MNTPPEFSIQGLRDSLAAVPSVAAGFAKEPASEIDALLDACRIDIAAGYAEPDPLLKLAGEYESVTPVLTRGNISMIQGKAKSRKTFFSVWLACTYLKQSDSNNGKVLYIDTEQSKFHVNKIQRRIYSLMEWDESSPSDRLAVYSLRELDTETRLQAVERLIERNNPDLVLIDGIRDCIHDFNDLTECSYITNMLMRLTSEYNNHICCVLHENKNDTNARGHAGTELQNKAETVISVEKNEELSLVKSKFARNGDFQEFAFRINNDNGLGVPELCEVSHQRGKDKNDRLQILFDELLPEGCNLVYSELVKRVMRKRSVKERRAAELVKEAIRRDFIRKNAGGYYFSVSNSKSDSEEELPL